MNDIVIPEIVISNWELATAALVMMAFLVSGMAISNKREWLKDKLWRKKTMYWVFGAVSIALLIPAIGHIFGMLYLTNSTSLTTSDQRSFAIILAAVVGAPFVIWRTWVAQRQADTDEQGLITDRITKAVEQLGAEKTVWEGGKQSSKPNLEVRLGGIYALERIAQDSERDHITVMEILCAYIRANSPASTAIAFPKGKALANIEYNKWKNSIGLISIDIQSVLDVIGRRNRSHYEGDYRLDLRKCNLQRAFFNGGGFDKALFNISDLGLADMERVNLNEAQFSATKLCGVNFSNASLEGVWFYKPEFNRADFAYAHTRLASMHSTDFAVALNLSEEQIKSMFGDGSTTLPDGITIPDNWPKGILTISEFQDHWKAAKKEAGLP